MDVGDRHERDDPHDRPQRARTLVVRCWQEGVDSAHGGVLRGTLRDLARGRAVSFEGLDALVGSLRCTLWPDDQPDGPDFL